VSEVVVISENEIEVIEAGAQGPAGVSAEIDQVSIDFNDLNKAEIKGFEASDNDTIIHKRSGLIEFVSEYADKKTGDPDSGNYSELKDDGSIQFFGTGRRYRDESSDALSLKVQGNGVSANVNENTQDFSTGADLNDWLYKNTHLNHDRDLNATHVYPHIHFFQNSNAMPNFLLQWRWQINGAAKDTLWKDLKCNTPLFTYVSGSLDQMAVTE
jgi:hypothetical protein